MGPYLSKPKTQITTSYDQGSHFKYCTAEMQGWRKTQEVCQIFLKMTIQLFLARI